MKKERAVFLFLILITLPTLLPFFNAKYFYTQDYIFIARLQQMFTALASGQFPVRWAPDLRYGEPVFNFYAALPYYIGAAIKLLGLNFIWVAKVLFVLSSILSALTMYIFCRKLFSKKAAILGAVLYTYAPYRAVDLYVRGALSEAWAFVFFPLIFYASLLLSEKITLPRISFLALSLAGLFLTHNVTTLMFLPFLVIFWTYLILRTKKWKFIISDLMAFILSLGLAAFFLLPAMLERQFIQTKYLLVGYFNFRAHFVAFSQFFSTFWGYGSSVWGPHDSMSFQVGLVHWAILVLIVPLGFFLRKNRKFLLLLAFLGLSFAISIILQHNKSAFVWEAIPLMAFIQFPWRFLAISIFIVSIIGAAIVYYIENKNITFSKLELKGKLNLVRNNLWLILILFTILVNFQYFRPKEYMEDSFFDKFLHTETMHKGVDLTKDYLPIWAQDVDGQRFDSPRASNVNIRVSDIKQTSTVLNFFVNVGTKSSIELPVTYFPGWEVRANKQLISQSAPSKMGLISFELPAGNYEIKAELKNTLIRTTGNIISAISVVMVGLLFVFRKKYYA